MKDTIVKVLVISVLLISGEVYAQPDNGRVSFDCPGVPSSQFQFDLSSDVIALVMDDPTSDIAPLFKSVNNLYLRNYRSRSSTYKKMVQHYIDALKKRSWIALGPSSQTDPVKVNFHLYILPENELVKGIFVIVRSDDGIYLINIVGEIPRRQLGELLLNLNQLGIEIRELMSLSPRNLEQALPPTPPTPEPARPDPDPNKTEKRKTAEPTPHEAPEEPQLWDWYVDGEPINELQIQSAPTTPEGTDPKRIEETITAEKDNIMKILKNGSGELREVMPVLAGVLDDFRKVSLRVTEEDAKRIAIISVTSTRKISVLKSMKIPGTNGKQVNISVDDRFVSHGDEVETPLAATRFWAKDVPIHEVRIRGNQKIPEERIRQTLDNASPDIDKALRTLFKVMPYFEEVRLQVDEEGAKYIATISVDEKPLSTDTYIGFNPLLSYGFNRVTGSEVGTNFEVGKRKEVGPLWMWRVGDSVRDQTSKLFGKVSYASGNERLHYRLGGTANWGKPYIWNLGITAQIHQLTDAIAPELFPNYNDESYYLFRILGGHDYPNYYLREGVEIALRWEPVMPTHSFKLSVVAESHDNLQKSTDWSIANWRSRRTVRENPPINPGSMRSITFQYDFDTRANSLGWHNTLLVEYSNSAFGSDFDFTRYQLHLRYAYPLGKHRFRTRLLFGFSNALLPIQRQFAISGPGGLRGYPLFSPANEAEREDKWYKQSRYAFAGDRGFLFNIEYHYRLSEIIDWGIFKSMFAVVFLDEGQVWNASNTKYTFEPSANIGVGLQFGSNDAMIRINVAKALNFNTSAKERLLQDPGFEVTSIWYHVF